MAGRVQPRQLAFALPHAESLTRDNFLEGPANAAGLALVDSWPDWPNRIMLLVGPEGSGKSHLAAIWAEQAGARSIIGACADRGGGAGRAGDRRAGGRRSEIARLRRTRAVSSDEPGAGRRGVRSDHRAHAAHRRFEIELRDLRSRLRAVPVVSLLPPDDQLFRALIVKFCADRQLIVDETVVSYLATRIERSFAAARQAVELLDTEALRLGRPVTRALAAELLRNA